MIQMIEKMLLVDDFEGNKQTYMCCSSSAMPWLAEDSNYLYRPISGIYVTKKHTLRYWACNGFLFGIALE
jgi:hypothetical protein